MVGEIRLCSAGVLYVMSHRMRAPRGAVVCAVLLVLASLSPTARGTECGEASPTSTYELIQTAIFERRGCAESICHGSAAAGGLDLRAGVSYDALVDAPAQSVSRMLRVAPGDKSRSLLWLNLAAKTYPDQYRSPLRPMPLDPVPALTPEELELIRIWLEGGAPESGVVPGSEMFDPCLPAPEPIPIKPLPPPAPGTGVQIKMPVWTLQPRSEREVCFASYYDITDQVPPQFRGPDGTTMRYKRNDVRQDNLSHHLIVSLYEGTAPPSHPEWGAWSCAGGARSGEPCDPTDLDACGEDGQCATAPKNTIACIGFGPADAGIGLMSAGFSGTQETASSFEFAPGVYREIPLKGMILWNSHAFNLSDKPGKLEAWLNFEFAPPEEQIAPVFQIFNAEEIFAMSAPPFSTDEICHIQVMPPRAQLFELSSHMHERGKRWRTFLGAFRCTPPGSAPIACSPFGYDMDTPDKCLGSPCVAMKHTRAGDCDRSGDVTVDEIITSVSIGLGESAVSLCYEADVDSSDSVSVDEIITAVNSALHGVPPDEPRDPEESLLYVSLIYNDPVVLRYDPPMSFPGPGSADDERSLTFCALYDNGYTNPAEVKRASTSPAPPVSLPFPVGGPCPPNERMCAEGRVGAACTGRSQAARDRSCDSAEGAGDGHCDACPLRGGVTTEDEMFLLLGQYFIR